MKHFETSPLLASFSDISTKKPSFGRNLDAIDGYRGLAVLLVIASHTNGLNLHGQGGLGVWIFFTLSSFLLVFPFAVKNRTFRNIKDIIKFWSRRINRVVPAYYFLLTVIFIFVTKDLRHYLLHLSFLQADGHFWSIPQELLSYILIPIILLLSTVIFRNKRALQGLALIALGLLLDIIFTKEIFHLNGNGVQLKFFVMPFLIGAGFAFLRGSTFVKNAMKRNNVRIALLLGGVLILLSFFFSAEYYLGIFSQYVPVLDYIKTPPAWNYPFYFALSSGILLLILTTYDKSFLAKIFQLHILRFIGIISFSLYLIHPSIISLLRGQTSSQHSQFLLVLLVSTLISIVTYGLIEKPFIRKDRRK